MAEEKAKRVEQEEGGLPKAFYDWLQALVMALVCIILIFTFVGRFIYVSGPSMQSTLWDKDMMIVQELGYTPRAGDVIIFTKPFRTETGPLVKRVIALGGQTVDIDYNAGTVSVDGVVLDEPYINEPMYAPGYENQSHIEVPVGSLFVMGDNRNHSNDSRDVTLGVIDERQVIGRAVCVVLPFQNFGIIERETGGRE